MKPTLETNSIESFLSLFQTGVESWIQAGKMLVEMVEQDLSTYDKIMAKCPMISAGVLGRFEQMGRGILHPHLLLTSSHGYSKLQALPYSMQEKLITEPIPLLVKTVNGVDILMVKVKDLTREQSHQAFASNRLRTEGEQRAWLMQQASNAAKPSNKPTHGYSIKNGKAVINGVEFTCKQLLSIVSELTK